MLKEFKEFALRGNVLDLAIGVIIGGAFGKIVSSLVDDLIMPIISLLTGGINFENLFIILQKGNAEKGIEEIAFRYGAFIQNLVDFLIIAFSIFLLVRTVNKISSKLKKEKEAEELKENPVPAPSDIDLLTDIKNLLTEIKNK